MKSYKISKTINNSNMKVLFIIFTILLLIVIMPIKIRVIRNDKHNDVDVYFIKLLNLRFDLDKFIRLLLTTKEDRDNVTIKGLIANSKIFIESYDFIKSIMKMVVITKSTIIYKVNSPNIVLEKYMTVLGWNIINSIRLFLMNNFKKVNNEYYAVHNEDDKLAINFEFVFNIRIVYLIFALIINIGDFSKIMKLNKKGSEKQSGTTTSNI